jgi:hypothetical protein
MGSSTCGQRYYCGSMRRMTAASRLRSRSARKGAAILIESKNRKARACARASDERTALRPRVLPWWPWSPGMAESLQSDSTLEDTEILLVDVEPASASSQALTIAMRICLKRCGTHSLVIHPKWIGSPYKQPLAAVSSVSSADRSRRDAKGRFHCEHQSTVTSRVSPANH